MTITRTAGPSHDSSRPNFGAARVTPAASRGMVKQTSRRRPSLEIVTRSTLKLLAMVLTALSA
jgi:hypothetical protein